jgi:nitrile hydratase accessory protein
MTADDPGGTGPTPPWQPSAKPAIAPISAAGPTAGPPDLALCPGLPVAADAQGADSPVFAEPWQAQAFAMTLQLHERGLFTWPEWAEALSQRIRTAQADGDPDDGSTYYRHWLAALESLVAAKGASDPSELHRTADAWGRAAERTPHGTPIELQAVDFQASESRR